MQASTSSSPPRTLRKRRRIEVSKDKCGPRQTLQRKKAKWRKRKTAWWTVGEIGRLLLQLREYGWYIQAGPLARALRTRSVGECSRVLDELRGFKTGKDGNVEWDGLVWIRLRRLVAIVGEGWKGGDEVLEKFAKWWRKDVRFACGDSVDFWKLKDEVLGLSSRSILPLLRWELVRDAVPGRHAWSEAGSVTWARASLIQYRNLLDYLAYARTCNKRILHADENDTTSPIAAISPRAVRYLADAAFSLTKKIILHAGIHAVPGSPRSARLITRQCITLSANIICSRRNVWTLANKSTFVPWSHSEIFRTKLPFPRVQRFVTPHTELSLCQLDPKIVIYAPVNVFDEANKLRELQLPGKPRTAATSDLQQHQNGVCLSDDVNVDDESSDCKSMSDFLVFLILSASRKNMRAAGCICYHRLAYIVLRLLGFRNEQKSSDEEGNTFVKPVFQRYVESTRWITHYASHDWSTFENIRELREELMVDREGWSGAVGINKEALDELWSVVDRHVRETAEILAWTADEDGGRCFIDYADASLYTAVLGGEKDVT